jgi:hypothetical protein
MVRECFGCFGIDLVHPNLLTQTLNLSRQREFLTTFPCLITLRLLELLYCIQPCQESFMSNMVSLLYVLLRTAALSLDLLIEVQQTGRKSQPF